MFMIYWIINKLKGLNMKKQLKEGHLQSLSIKNIEKSSFLVGVGIVEDGIITEGKSKSGDIIRTAIFTLNTKEIEDLIKNLQKLV